MAGKIICEACQFWATMIVGHKALCYFCARQTIFDMVRNSPRIKFVNGAEADGLKVIDYSVARTGGI